MSSELTCPFDKAWIGPCGQPVTERSMCAEHAPLVCKSCGAPATQSCEFDGGQFVCGAPLCADCEHLPPPPDAYFGVGSGHAKKDVAQRAWAERAKQW